MQDFQDVPIEWGGLEAFSRRVYEFIRRIPAGNTMTYGEIARELGRRVRRERWAKRWEAIRCHC